MSRWQAFGLLVAAASAGCAASLILFAALAWFLVLRPLGQAFGQ